MPGFLAKDVPVLALCAATFVAGLALIALGAILDPRRG